MLPSSRPGVPDSPAPGPAAAHAPATPDAVAAATGAPAGFVQRHGQLLTLDGEPYRFTGVNIYNANSHHNFWYGMTGEGELDRALTDIGPGKNAIRAWFGQWLANPDGDGLDFSHFDATLATARRHGYKVVVVLGEQSGIWDDGIVKTLDSGWYTGGYADLVSPHRSDWGAVNTMTYRDYVAEVVTRYRDDDTVLMWQLMNEAEAPPADHECPEPVQQQAARALRGFADDMGAMVKELDPYHLLSLGTIGTGQCGTNEELFQYVHAGPHIDLTEMHDYRPHEDVIGDRWNGMAVRLRQSAALDKPLFVGEMGISVDDAGGAAQRATRYREKIRAQFDAGVVGVLAWNWRSAHGAGGDQYVIGPGDPVLEALRLGSS